MPQKPTPDEDDEDADDYSPVSFVPDPIMTQPIRDVWDRKRRMIQSRKDAVKMWAPIMESFRAYGELLVYVYMPEDLGR